MPDQREKKAHHEQVRGRLLIDRSTWENHWQEIADAIMPRRIRFHVTDTNKGHKKNNRITDPTATLALRTLQSGMMAGVTSPARPWFRLTTPDRRLADFGPVKHWLTDVEQIMTSVFLRSNLYKSLPVLYGDLGAFATGCMFVEEDFDSVFRTYTLPIGSYMLGNDEKLRVRLFWRDFEMTVRQVVERFGRRGPEYTGGINWTNISTHIRDEWTNGHFEHRVTIAHVIEPNPDYDPSKAAADPSKKKFASSYYERGGSDQEESHYLSSQNYFTYLEESGYDFFPVLAPRWEVVGQDTYGQNSPGMLALGDIRALQVMQKRSLQAVEKVVNPPLGVPNHLKQKAVSSLPGDNTFYNVREGGQRIEPLYQINPRIEEIENKIREHQFRIGRSFFDDLFRSITTLRRPNVTATEIDERKEEKLIELGSMLQNLNGDLLDPLIDIAFDLMTKQNLIPEAPPELNNVKLKVVYISIMEQAQKAVGLGGIDRFTSYMGSVQAVVPNLVDVVDWDQAAQEYADITGVPSRMIRDDKQIDEIRQKRAQEERAAAQAQNIPAVAKAAKDLGGAKTTGDNALAELLQASAAGNAGLEEVA